MHMKMLCIAIIIILYLAFIQFFFIIHEKIFFNSLENMQLLKLLCLEELKWRKQDEHFLASMIIIILISTVEYANGGQWGEYWSLIAGEKNSMFKIFSMF